MSNTTLEIGEIRSFGPAGPWYRMTSWLPLVAVYRAWTANQHCLFLDSATTTQSVGRYSFLMSDPIEWQIHRDAKLQDWHSLKQTMCDFQVDWPPSAPPFCGGAAGLLSYDWCRALEDIEAPQRDDFQVPALAIGIYDRVIVWDREKHECWLIATGYPQLHWPDRQACASLALEHLAEGIRLTLNDAGNSIDSNIPLQTSGLGIHSPQMSDIESEKTRPANSLPQRPLHELHSIALDQTTYHAIPETGTFTNASILTASPIEEYRTAIEQAKDYLYAGDIFQVNLAQQMIAPIQGTATEYYLRMRATNPAPMMGYFDLGSHQIVSASPERLYAQRGREIETRPIKGTCPRTGDDNKDRILGEKLQASEKNCAENVMIVDLLRNDLSRVCEDDSVTVKSLCELEQYEFVQHLTSSIIGTLRPDQTAWEVIPAIFPGGSISGAPKVRAMEIINELEPVARGAYCGSLGYISFADHEGHANADWNILIRTVTVMGRWCQIPVGGGIVLDSESGAEFVETLHKARGMLTALDTPSTEASAK